MKRNWGWSTVEALFITGDPVKLLQIILWLHYEECAVWKEGGVGPALPLNGQAQRAVMIIN